MLELDLAAERIVVQATAQDKRAIVAKAGKLKMPISELMRRGAFAYRPESEDEELATLAEAAQAAAERSVAHIDTALLEIAASNRRIAAMEAKAANAANAPKAASSTRRKAA